MHDSCNFYKYKVRVEISTIIIIVCKAGHSEWEGILNHQIKVDKKKYLQRYFVSVKLYQLPVHCWNRPPSWAAVGRWRGQLLRWWPAAAVLSEFYRCTISAKVMTHHWFQDMGQMRVHRRFQHLHSPTIKKNVYELGINFSRGKHFAVLPNSA